MTGILIAIEGMDGSGKSSVTKALHSLLRTKTKTPIRLVREPGGTPMAEDIRSVFLRGTSKDESFSEKTQLLLLMASRAQLFENVVRPALAMGEIVILDRHVLSTLVYQRSQSPDVIMKMNLYATGFHTEDYPLVTLLLDVNAEESRKRRSGRDSQDNFEKSKESQFESNRKYMKDFIHYLPGDFNIIETNGREFGYVVDACMDSLKDPLGLN